MRIDSSRYVSMGIYDGDLLIIDRAKPVTKNSLVVYESEGQFVIGRAFTVKKGAVITGAVTNVIHTVKES